jgi:hypothetical protein
MCDEISKVIEEVGQAQATVIAVCTDKAANMKKAWELLKEKYPALNCYGCLAHGLNLIFTDALKIDSLRRVLNQCTSVIKCIKNSHLLLDKFTEKQKSEGCTITLKLPVKTRYVIVM